MTTPAPVHAVPTNAHDLAKSMTAPDGYILTVDDEGSVREFMKRCLEHDGYVVRAAGNAAEALEHMMAEPATAVLCDIRMPGQDGLWLTERLRARWSQTPVVMASAIDDVQTLQKSRDLGAAGYITKPIRPEQLREMMRRVLTKHTAPSTQSHEDQQPSTGANVEAEYVLESPVRCPSCGERVMSLKAIRLIRSHVSFTSTLPRRGRLLACPHCAAVVPAELSNF